MRCQHCVSFCISLPERCELRLRLQQARGVIFDHAVKILAFGIRSTDACQL